MMRRYELKKSGLPQYAAPSLAKFGTTRTQRALTTHPTIAPRAGKAPKILISVAPIVPSVLL